MNDEARRRNGRLPGTGGVFNLVNLHVYHYAGNNPVKYVDPDGNAPNDSIFGFSLDPREDFVNFWGSILGNLSAFLGNKTAQNNITVKGQYFLQEFDKKAVSALSTVSGASSKVSIFFLMIGQPEAAAATSALGLVAEGMLIAHDWAAAMRNNDQAGMNRAVRDGTFIVAGMIIGNQAGKAIGKALSITADGKTISYTTTGKKWEDLQKAIRNEFGNLSGSMVEEILDAAKKVYYNE